MIEKLLQSFMKGFEFTQYLVDDDSGWYLQSTCSFNEKVIYTSKLDLLPLYESMQRRSIEK